MVPSFRALLTVDAEGYSRHNDAALPTLHTEIRQAIGEACELSGLEPAWRDVRVLQSTGDGVIAILPHDCMVALIHPFSDRLQEVLAKAAPRLRAARMSLRLRVALHVGLVDEDHPVTAGISTATNDVCRLLDCPPLKAALRDSDPDVTFVAMILSSEAFDLFVRGGHTALEPSQLTEIRAQVKQFDRPAYLYVPVPSRRPPGDATKSADEPAVPPSPGPGSTSFGNVSVSGQGSQNIVGSNIGGNVRQNRS